MLLPLAQTELAVYVRLVPAVNLVVYPPKALCEVSCYKTRSLNPRLITKTGGQNTTQFHIVL
jgi:hypothetical protein